MAWYYCALNSLNNCDEWYHKLMSGNNISLYLVYICIRINTNNLKHKAMKAITKLIDKVETGIDQDLKKEFDAIILSNIINYGKDKKALKSFFEDLQRGGCQIGFINEFIYHDSCKEFYIEHIDALEDFKTELEEQLGEPIRNRKKLPHYTFMCWLVFEEYCFQVYSAIFE